MARFVTVQNENGMEVVIAYEEGVKKKRIKREQKNSFHMLTMHKTNDHYDYSAEKIEYHKGDQTI